jgi:DNA-binding NtrC family response regulator
MPARIVIVHDEQQFADSLTAALTSAGYDVAPFMDPVAALNALDEARRVEVLVTRIEFHPGQPHGVSLARMARHKRPGIHTVFIGPSALAEHTAELGEFIPTPASIRDVMRAVIRLLTDTVDCRSARTTYQACNKFGESHDRNISGRG